MSSLDFDNREQILMMDLDSLVDKMLANIGSTDPVLRDRLIYTTFGNLIYRDFLNIGQLHHILKTCLSDDYLYHQIGEMNKDSVFKRSFTTLVITLILNKDSEMIVIPKDDIIYAIGNSARYLKAENDTRGYVEGKGWAHSIAHGADFLAASIHHPYFMLDHTYDYLESITACLFKKDAAYKDDEDERLLFAIDALIDKNAKSDVLEDWVLAISSELDDLLKQKDYPFNTRINVTAFLKSLYFRLLFKDVHPAIRNIIQGNLMKWYGKIYF